MASACGTKPPAQAPDPTDEPAASAGADAPSPPPVVHNDKPIADPEEKPAEAPGQACTGLSVDLVATLSKAACEVGDGKVEDKPRDYKGVLEVKAVPASAKVAPGGVIEVTLLFTNKGKGVLPLSFFVNPLPRFEIETYDAKGKRVDVPAGDHPKWPSGHDAAPSAEKTARVLLPENGTGRVVLPWTASRMRWAPEKAKGAAQGSPFPRVAAGPLPKGKYTLRIVTPMLGAMEGPDHEVSAPKITLDVGK